jgi:D-xylose transport system ATP-binding protein
MPMPLVRVEHLRKEFGAVVAVDGVTFDADGGEVVALVGDNGAGKSTVVNCLAGVNPPTSGRILLDGPQSSSRTRSKLAGRGSRPSSKISRWPSCSRCT